MCRSVATEPSFLAGIFQLQSLSCVVHGEEGIYQGTECPTEIEPGKELKNDKFHHQNFRIQWI